MIIGTHSKGGPRGVLSLVRANVINNDKQPIRACSGDMSPGKFHTHGSPHDQILDRGVVDLTCK